MKIQHFLIGIIVAGSFVFGMSFFAIGLQQTSGTVVNTSFNETYDKLDEMLALSSNAQNQIRGEDVQENPSDQALEQSGFSILKAVTFTSQSFDLVVTMLEETAKSLGIDRWAEIIIAIISFLLLFAVIAAIFGRKI